MIETPRLLLRRFQPEDAGPYAELMLDAESMRYLPEGPARGMDEAMARAERHIALFEAHWQARGYGVFAAEGRREERLVGRVGLRFLPEIGETEALWLIGRPFTRDGLATEAARASLDFGFRRAGLERIVALAMSENLASLRVMAKLAMTYERHVRFMQLTCVLHRTTRRDWG